MKKQYLIDLTTSLAVWCGDDVPVLTSTNAKCGSDIFLCFNANNSMAFEADEASDFVQNKYRVAGQGLVVDPSWVAPVLPDLLPQLKADLVTQIDDAVGSIITNISRFILGYEEREKVARTYKDAGYTGAEVDWILQYSVPANKTYRQAVDIIIAQSDGWRGAHKNLEALRMQKYNVLSASTKEDAQNIFNTIMQSVKYIASQL